MRNNNCIYFVEGSCEKVLIDALKEKPALIVPGRTKVFNAISNELTRSMLVTIQSGTTVSKLTMQSRTSFVSTLSSAPCNSGSKNRHSL